MRKSADHRVARHAFAPALPAPPVRRHDTTLDHRPIRLQPLPDGLETEFVQTSERGEIGRNKSRVGHVEVFRMGSVRTSILKETSTPTRLATRSTTYTLVHEEPVVLDNALDLTTPGSRAIWRTCWPPSRNWSAT